MKKRADALLVEQGLADSREKAKRLIMAGKVLCGTQRIDKPSVQLEEHAALAVQGGECPFVSRGGLKLQKALAVFDFLKVEGQVFLDVGASTGGFTDCLLQHGARRVYAIDVGYGQLDWRLRQDGRVTVLERVNARNLQVEQVERADGAVMDVSFISITKVLPAVFQCMKPQAAVVTLIKPQFEAGRGAVGKKGVVREAATHRKVIEDVLAFLNAYPDWRVVGLDFSPIRGPEGNVEFLLALQRGEGAPALGDGAIQAAEVVAQAHAAFQVQ